MNVDRGEYGSRRVIICPLPTCRHSWCKECLKPISLASSQTEHNCKQHGFERLMRKKGWKYCPGMFCLIPFAFRPVNLALGCKTPVQKETGCNHMTVSSVLFFFELLINISFVNFSAGLLDAMCKSF
jgi:hypothetical protein